MPSIMLSETNEDYQGTRRIDRSRAQVPQARWLPVDAKNAISFSRLVDFLSESRAGFRDKNWPRRKAISNDR